MNKEEYFEKFDQIARSFSKKDKIAIVHDLDADGVCSGAIAFNAIKILREKEPDLVITQSKKITYFLSETIELLKKNNITKIVVVDMALDQNQESIKQSEKFAELLVIDHHSDYNYPKNNKTFIIKAQFVNEIDPSKYPAAKLVFDLFSRVVDLEKISWISCVGLIGDNQLKQWRNFVEESVKLNFSSITEFEKITHIISSVEVLEPKKLNELLLFIVNASSPKEVLKSKYYEFVKELDLQIEEVINKFQDSKELYEEIELVWFEFKAKNNLKSAVINRVSNELFPNLTVIFLQDKGDAFFWISARRQDFKVQVNTLLEDAVKEFSDAGAGGHIPAAAGRIRKEDKKIFKENIISLLELKKQALDRSLIG